MMRYLLIAVTLVAVSPAQAQPNFQTVRGETYSHGHVAWPTSIAKVEQCYGRIDQIVEAHPEFVERTLKSDLIKGNATVEAKDRIHHFYLFFTCDHEKRTAYISVMAWKNQIGSAVDLFDVLVKEFVAAR